MQPHGLVAHQAPLSMGFSKLEYLSGLPFPSPGNLPNPEIEPRSPASQVDSLPAEPSGKPQTLCTCAQLSPALCDPMDCSLTRLLCPWDFSSKSTGVGCHFLLQGIFPTRGSNPGLLYCRQTLYQLSHKGSMLPGERSPKVPRWPGEAWH